MTSSRRWFVRDKLLSVNHHALINLGFCVTAGVQAAFHDIACAQIDARFGRATAEASTHVRRLQKHLLRTVGQSVAGHSQQHCE